MAKVLGETRNIVRFRLAFMHLTSLLNSRLGYRLENLKFEI